jgi:very-short-patch-repair endonuclease
MRPRIPLPSPLDRAPFARATGLEAGLGTNRLNGPDLLRPFHGVRHPAHLVLNLEARCRAFSTRMPPTAFFNCVTGAVLTGIPLPRALEESRVLHVAVPAPAHASAAKGVIGHKVQLMGGDVRVLRGLRVSTPARAWCELGGELKLADLVAAGDHLIHWELPLCTLAELEDAVSRYPGQRGRGVLRRALPLLSDRSESPRESNLRVLLTHGGIQGLVANLWITVRGMRFRADLALPHYKLVLEYQSEYHNDPVQWRKDMTKREILATDGWLTMDINSDDLQSTELVERIRMVLASRPRLG